VQNLIGMMSKLTSTGRIILATVSRLLSDDGRKVRIRTCTIIRSCFNQDIVITCGLTDYFGSTGPGKDLMWYARDGKQTADEAAVSAREEIERVKQEEDEAMRVIY
jgi:hypothetical protein